MACARRTLTLIATTLALAVAGPAAAAEPAGEEARVLSSDPEWRYVPRASADDEAEAILLFDEADAVFGS
jgi:hypothetical protein